MQTASFTTHLTDKGYILLPVRVRRMLKLQPKQALHMRVKDKNTIELDRMPTLDEVFAHVKPAKKPITRAQIRREKQLAQELMASNAASEGL